MNRKIQKDFPNVPSISTTQLADWLKDSDRDDPVIVDVRKDEEFEVSHLRNAIHLAKTDAVIKHFSENPTDEAIVLYCSVGYRSARATTKLLEAGHQNVFNLDGSIFQWVNEGRTVYQADKEVSKVHPFSWFWNFLLK